MQITVRRPIASQIEVGTTATRVVHSGIGLQGPSGLDASGQSSTEFSFGDATPVLLKNVLAGQVVFSVDLYILEAFDGAGAAISVGDDGDHERLVAEDDNMPSSVGSYSNTPAHEYGSATDVKLWITPGAGANTGRGIVVLNLES